MRLKITIVGFVLAVAFTTVLGCDGRGGIGPRDYKSKVMIEGEWIPSRPITGVNLYMLKDSPGGRLVIVFGEYTDRSGKRVPAGTTADAIYDRETADKVRATKMIVLSFADGTDMTKPVTVHERVAPAPPTPSPSPSPTETLGGKSPPPPVPSVTAGGGVAVVPELDKLLVSRIWVYDFVTPNGFNRGNQYSFRYPDRFDWGGSDIVDEKGYGPTQFGGKWRLDGTEVIMVLTSTNFEKLYTIGSEVRLKIMFNGTDKTVNGMYLLDTKRAWVYRPDTKGR